MAFGIKYLIKKVWNNQLFSKEMLEHEGEEQNYYVSCLDNAKKIALIH